MTMRIAAAAAALMAGTAALAHSMVTATDPADGAALTAAPEVIRIEFSEPIRLVGVAISGAGRDAALEVPSAGAARYALEAPDLPAGDYRVEWRGMAGDGHVMTGAFSFAVE
jgi:methionine-rich copper-binding protein CopC